MEKQLPVWSVAANILNKQSRTADTGWFSSLGVGRGANNSSTSQRIMLRNLHTASSSIFAYILNCIHMKGIKMSGRPNNVYS